MKIILTKEVLGLGDPGDVVKVKNGYGRNYLVPQGMAIEATKHNVALVEAERKRLAAAMASEAEKVKSEAQRLAGLKLSIKAKSGEGGKLYGSVTNMDLAKILAEQGFEIDRRRIILEEGPLKKLGEHTIKIKLHPQVVEKIAVTVEPEAGDIPVKAEEPEAEAAVEAAEEAPAPEEAAVAEEAEAAAEAAEPEEAEEEAKA